MKVEYTHFGFTGTQKGMTEAQKDAVRGWMKYQLGYIVVHHGDCIGADAEFHALVRKHRPDARIVIHPPVNPDKRAYCDGDEYREPKPYLQRNREIARIADFLIATPAQRKEQMRGSGTWATVRYFKTHDKTPMILAPDGESIFR